MFKKYKLILIFFSICLLSFTLAYYFLIKTYTYKGYKKLETKPILTHSPTLTVVYLPTPTSIPTPTPTPDIFAGLKSQYFFITFYGWPDNTPPGNEIAFPKKYYPATHHDFASGIGTYNNPITFASDANRVPLGTIYYVVNLKKYIIMEDSCLGCIDSWNSGKKHLDIWMESDANFQEELDHCQGHLTKESARVITNPPANLPVNTLALFNKATGRCNF